MQTEKITEKIKDFRDLAKLLPVQKHVRRKDRGKHGFTYQQSKATPIKWNHILAFIVIYQRDHNGQTPTATAIGNEIGGFDDNTVRWHLRRMEERGMIHIMSTRPLRVVVTDEKLADLASARRLDGAVKDGAHAAPTGDPGAKSRYLEAEATRQRCARLIGGWWQAHGRGPSLYELQDALGYRKAGPVMAMLDILVKRGLVEGEAHARKLTEAGMATFGFSHPAPASGVQADKPEDKEEGDMNDRKVVVVPVQQKAVIPMARFRQVAEAIHTHWEGVGEAPSFNWIGARIGFSGSAAIRFVEEMVERGWAEHETGRKRDIRLTEAGRSTLLGFQAEPEEEAEATVTEVVVKPDVMAMLHEEATMPELRPAPVNNQGLSCVDTADLILELNDRGYLVRRV